MAKLATDQNLFQRYRPTAKVSAVSAERLNGALALDDVVLELLDEVAQQVIDSEIPRHCTPDGANERGCERATRGSAFNRR